MQKKDRVEVRCEHAAPFGERQGLEGRVWKDAGVVDEDVDTPVIGEYAGHRGAYGCLIGDIDRRPPVEVEGRDGHPRVPEALRDRAADPARAARHDSDLAVERHGLMLRRHRGRLKLSSEGQIGYRAAAAVYGETSAGREGWRDDPE